MSAAEGSAEEQARKIAKQLGALRHRGLSAVEADHAKQDPIEADELTTLAMQHVVERLGRVWDLRGGMKRFLMDSLTAFGAEPEYAEDAQLVDSLFFDRTGKHAEGGPLLKSVRESMDIQETRFRTNYQNPVFLSFARYLVTWDGSTPEPRPLVAPLLIPLQGEQLAQVAGIVDGATPLQTTPMLLTVGGRKILIAINLFVVSVVLMVLGGAAWLARYLWDGSLRWAPSGDEPSASGPQNKDDDPQRAVVAYERSVASARTSLENLVAARAELMVRKMAAQAALDQARDIIGPYVGRENAFETHSRIVMQDQEDPPMLRGNALELGLTMTICRCQLSIQRAAPES